MTINNRFNIGQEVYLKTDPDQLKRIICQIAITPGAALIYQLALASQNSWHYEIEISATEDQLLKINRI